MILLADSKGHDYASVLIWAFTTVKDLTMQVCWSGPSLSTYAQKHIFAPHGPFHSIGSNTLLPFCIFFTMFELRVKELIPAKSIYPMPTHTLSLQNSFYLLTILTFTTLANSTNNKFWWYFSYFSQKTVDISCKLSPFNLHEMSNPVFQE